MPNIQISPPAPGRESNVPRWRYAVLIRRERGGPELGRHVISDSDLSDLRSEAWLASCLRKGCTDVAHDELPVFITPIFPEGSAPQCSGIAVEVKNPVGEKIRRGVPLDAFVEFASRAAAPLRAEGVLAPDERFYYELIAEEDTRPPDCVDESGLIITAHNPPLEVVKARLRPNMERARTVGEPNEAFCPVFYTLEAYERAERFARLGAKESPPVETGAVLVGYLGSCPESSELYVVVTDALEVADAESGELSLSYTGKTWARVQAVVRGMRSRPETAAHRIVGQAHGHNFLPAGGAPPCEECHSRAVCSRSTAFISQADRDWTRAVFCKQPWSLCHIFGWNARAEPVHALYGLCDNRLVPRPFHILPDPEPDRTA
jgi:hypothetical protein